MADAAARREQRRQMILSGPILPTLLRLGLPTILVLFAQTLVAVAETAWTSLLGTDALAGVALVFPLIALMTSASNGGIGGGVSSAVARAVGAGRAAEADALLLHAVVLAVLFGLAFTALALGAGPAIYRLCGGVGATEDAAELYSAWVFAGAVPIWVVNLVASALRGAGEVRIPARVTLAGAAVIVVLSPLLIFGWGPLPGLGVGGAGLAMCVYYAGASVVLLRYLLTGRGALRLARTRLRWPLFRDILRVGLVSAANNVLANLTLLVVTGAIGGFGVAALAGYGIASRIDWLLIPLLFGFGTAVVTVVGASTGAGLHDRAVRATWTAVLVGSGVTEAVGLLVALWPTLWLERFTADPEVIRAGAAYLRVVAPSYGFLGMGMILAFACQGRGRMLWPFVAGMGRVVVAAGGGWLAARHAGSVAWVFAAMALGSVAIGGLNLAGFSRSAVRRPVPPAPAAA